jgi:sulfur relay (sulfurtransferase) complex TusBCD TusD component (DsrE family)
MEKAIKKFVQISGHKPERIFFYRDGVGEHQLKLVSDVEVKQILAAFEAAGLKKTALVFINVCKRVNTRLFA